MKDLYKMKEIERLLQLAGKKNLTEAYVIRGKESNKPLMYQSKSKEEEEKIDKEMDYWLDNSYDIDDFVDCDACFGDSKVDGLPCKKCLGAGQILKSELGESSIFPKLNEFTKSFNNRHLVEARNREFQPGDRVLINDDPLNYHGVVKSVHFPVADLEIGATIDPTNTSYEVKVDGGQTKRFSHNQLSPAFTPNSTYRHTISPEGIHSFIGFPNNQREGRTVASWLNQRDADELIKKYKLDTKWKDNVKRTK